MLSQAVKDALNKSNDWPSAKNKLGDLLHGNFNVCKGNWKFSRDGGAVGDYSLKDLGGVGNMKIPSGAIVLAAFVKVRAAVTSAGLLTLDVNCEAANDTLAAEAVAGLTLGAKIQGIPDFGTLADSLDLTAERTVSISLNAFAATAGELDVYFFYV